MNINEILKSDYDLLCKDYKKATKKLEKQDKEIEKLREENTHLGMLNVDLEVYLKEHKARIDKAIKFINTHDLYHLTNEVILLQILRGEENDNDNSNS